ncbi:myb-like protein AA [Syngnathus acus]|uniref:myb-like protein AA n=1 Tax=Syngnathus acus TaxID=161584 RepID=UPI001885D819|nr:myb-like protein AA [Syngnathus acus]
MRHRYAGAVYQHQIPQQKRASSSNSSNSSNGSSSKPSGEPDAPVFSLPPPPSSCHHRDRASTTDVHRRSLQELPCVSQPTPRAPHGRDTPPRAGSRDSARRERGVTEGSTGEPATLKQEPWAPAPVFSNCHCSFSTQEATHSQNQHHRVAPPQPSPPFPPPIPPPPSTTSSSSLLFSRESKRGDRLGRSANNYQQASIVERCRGGGGAVGQRDHRQLQQQQQQEQQQQQQQQHCHPRLPQRDSSPEGICANSQKRCTDRRALEPQTQEQQIPQLRARQQLLVGSSLPINHCASGSGELCRTHQAPLLQRQQQQQQQQPPPPPQQQQQQQQPYARTPAPGDPHGATPPATEQADAAKSSATGSSNHSNSNSSRESPNYGSSYHLWPESPHKGEERIRIELRKLAP